VRRVATVLSVLVAGCGCGFALNPSLDISQYAHTAWTVRDGFSLGNIYAMAQTPDGYLWLGGEFGIFRFDGIRTMPWEPPAGQHLAGPVFRLLSARDGTLWIGTFAGLASWNGGKLKRRAELNGQVVGSLIEDREGTAWAGSWQGGPPSGRLCAIRSGGSQCYGEDGAFGKAVSSLYEDRSGNLWAGTASGLWRWKPGPPKRYATPPMELTGVTESGDGRLVIAEYGAGLLQFAGDKVGSYAIRGPGTPNRLLRDRKIDANKLLRTAMAVSGSELWSGDSSQPRRAGEGSFQVHARRAGSRLERGGQRPPGAVFEPPSPALPLPRNRLQHQRSVERDGRLAGILHQAGVLPDEWISRLCAAVVLAMVWMAYQLRVRRLQRQYNMRVEERTRIARELHDTLLQTVQGFMLRVGRWSRMSAASALPIP
jgi:hypothetical protein